MSNRIDMIAGDSPDAAALIDQRSTPVSQRTVIFGMPAIASHRRGFSYTPIDDPSMYEEVRSIIANDLGIGIIRPGNLRPRVKVDKAFMRDLAQNGQQLTAQRAQLNIAANTTQRFYFAPALGTFIGGVTTQKACDILAAGIGLNLNNQNGQRTNTAIVRVLSYTGSATGSGGSLIGDTDEIEFSLGLGVQDNVFVLPQTIQQNAAEHAPLEGYGTRRLGLVGPAGPLVLQDPVTLDLYNPASLIGTKGENFGVLADIDGGGTVTFENSGRPFYAVSIQNTSSSDAITGQAVALSGFYGQILLDAIAASR